MHSKRNKIKDMGLKQKINMFTRSNMVNGIMQPSGTEKNYETKQIIDNLGELEKCGSAAQVYNQSRQQYLEFLKDP